MKSELSSKNKQQMHSFQDTIMQTDTFKSPSSAFDQL